MYIVNLFNIEFKFKNEQDAIAFAQLAYKGGGPCVDVQYIKKYIIMVNGFYLTRFDREGMYLTDIKQQARRFNSKESAEDWIKNIPHPENRMFAIIVEEK